MTGGLPGKFLIKLNRPANLDPQLPEILQPLIGGGQNHPIPLPHGGPGMWGEGYNPRRSLSSRIFLDRFDNFQMAQMHSVEISDPDHQPGKTAFRLSNGFIYLHTVSLCPPTPPSIRKEVPPGERIHSL